MCINKGLELFCKSSGKKVNYGNSWMLCSNNISTAEAERLSTCFGMPLTKKMGKYLGDHVLSGGRNGDVHKDLVDRVRSRLDGWKMRCLSRAGRITLAQSVLSSLPIFQMQLEWFSCWVHKALDGAMGSCAWAGTETRRGIL